LKICFVAHSAEKYGAERSLLETIEAFNSSGVDCFVLFPKKGPLLDYIEAMMVPYAVIPYKRWAIISTMIDRVARITINLLMFFPVIYTISKHKCDIVYTNTITMPMGAFAAKLLGKPHVWHIREFGYEDKGMIFDLGDNLSHWLINKLSAVCIVNSKAILKKYKKFIDTKKLHLVYQAVNVEQTHSKCLKNDNIHGEYDIVCSIIGSITQNKKQEEAIQAIAELSNEGIKAKLLIIGDGNPEYKKYLYKLVDEKNLEDSITFTGFIDNPHKTINCADLVIVCSLFEAFGRVTIEAMRLAKPVIGARSGGTEELIQDGINGFLYTPGNYLELAEKIKLFVEDKALARQLGLKGQKWAAINFSKQLYKENLLKIILPLSEN
jgi:glycosyltransferase involved in cell wall biosynthesis